MTPPPAMGVTPSASRADGDFFGETYLATFGGPHHCGDCRHLHRVDHPNLGHCAASEREDIAGLWDTDGRLCESFEGRA